MNSTQVVTISTDMISGDTAEISPLSFWWRLYWRTFLISCLGMAISFVVPLLLWIYLVWQSSSAEVYSFLMIGIVFFPLFACALHCFAFLPALSLMRRSLEKRKRLSFRLLRDTQREGFKQEHQSMLQADSADWRFFRAFIWRYVGLYLDIFIS